MINENHTHLFVGALTKAGKDKTQSFHSSLGAEQDFFGRLVLNGPPPRNTHVS
jgi:hypothetical protein